MTIHEPAHPTIDDLAAMALFKGIKAIEHVDKDPLLKACEIRNYSACFVAVIVGIIA